MGPTAPAALAMAARIRGRVPVAYLTTISFEAYGPAAMPSCAWADATLKRKAINAQTVSNI